MTQDTNTKDICKFQRNNELIEINLNYCSLCFIFLCKCGQSDHQAVAPAAFLICSNESQNVRDQGAILSQHGRKPLYRAEKQKIIFLSPLFDFILTKKSLPPDGLHSTIYRALVHHPSSKLVCFLVHYAGLHYVCWRSHYSSNQARRKDHSRI